MKKYLLIGTAFAIAACGGSGGKTVAAPRPPVQPGATSISAVQGSAAASPLLGQTVSIAAIVTGDFQDNDSDTVSNLGGFYVQQETPDSDALTSEGVFIFEGDHPITDVDVGDRVDITGTVNVYFNETQISATSVTVTGTGMVQATDINLPVAAITRNSDGDKIADLERYEGMLVRFPQKLTVSNLYSLERYGEGGVCLGGR